ALEVWGGDEPPDLEVVPGITALVAASALLGAPLGMDFVAISLSDLLVPWATIARRLDAAAGADFVLALYNPASGARRWQLGEACAILARHRRPTTPVGIVRAAYRPEQEVTIVELAALPSARVDMVTILLVGNGETRRVGE